MPYFLFLFTFQNFGRGRLRLLQEAETESEGRAPRLSPPQSIGYKRTVERHARMIVSLLIAAYFVFCIRGACAVTVLQIAPRMQNTKYAAISRHGKLNVAFKPRLSR